MKGAWQISDGGTDEGRTEAQIDQSDLKGPTGTNESAWCMKPAGLRRQPITGRTLNEITNHAPWLASSFPISDKAPHTFSPSFTPQQAANCSLHVCCLTCVCRRACVRALAALVIFWFHFSDIHLYENSWISYAALLLQHIKTLQGHKKKAFFTPNCWNGSSVLSGGSSKNMPLNPTHSIWNDILIMLLSTTAQYISQSVNEDIRQLTNIPVITYIVKSELAGRREHQPPKGGKEMTTNQTTAFVFPHKSTIRRFWPGNSVIIWQRWKPERASGGVTAWQGSSWDEWKSARPNVL